MISYREPAAAVDAYLSKAIGREPRAGVRMALDLLDQGVPSDAVISDLLGAAQREVGEHWLRDEFTVADEHLVSGVTQKALDAVANAIEAPVPHGFVIVACAEGDWHSLPAQMFAEQLRANGFAVAFLGASTPVGQVAKMIARHRPDALAVSCTLPLYFSGLSRLADAAHGQGVPVLAGGRALGPDPRRAIRLGADGWGATVTDAVTVLDGWKDRPPQISAASTMLEPAALHLDASSASLAATAFDKLVVEFPRMKSYNDEQLASTREELAFIVQFVAAARLVDDPAVLTEFLAWLGTLLGNRGVPPLALDAGLRVLAPLIGDLDTPAGEMTLESWAVQRDAPYSVPGSATTDNDAKGRIPSKSVPVSTGLMTVQSQPANLMDKRLDDRAIPGLLLGDLSSTDELLAAIVALPDPIYILRTVRSPEGELTELIYEYVNPAAAALIQMPVPSIVGHGIKELFPSVADPSIWGCYVEALDTGKPVSLVTAFDDGGVKGAFRVTATAFLGGLLLLTSQDVSELTKIQTRLRAVMDSLLDPHIQLEPIRDGAGKIIDFELADANPAAREYFRQPHEKLIGMRLLTLEPGVSTELLEMLVNVVETGEPLILDDHVYEQKLMGGAQRHFDVRVAKMNGGVTYTWRDVTDRHQQQAKEQERVAELEQFHRLTIGRELKMLELKNEIEHLKELGTPPPGTDPGGQY